MKRTWTTAGEELVERLGRPAVETAVERMEWQTIPVGGTLEVGFLPGHSINAAVAELGIPKVSAVAISSFERPGFYPGFYGVEGHYSNGRARVYLLDTGTEVVTLLSDFWSPEEEAVQVGQVWRNDTGQKFLVDRVEGGWVYTKDPRAPKRSRALGEIPRAWFSRPGWTVVS